jgi:hypothetical protein
MYLWTVYGVRIGLAAVATIIGTFSVMEKGIILKDTQFPAIVAFLRRLGLPAE